MSLGNNSENQINPSSSARKLIEESKSIFNLQVETGKKRKITDLEIDGENKTGDDKEPVDKEPNWLEIYDFELIQKQK